MGIFVGLKRSQGDPSGGVGPGVRVWRAIGGT